MPTELQNFLSFSAIIASLVALGGVIWSNAKTSDRQGRDLRHDSKERHRDRIENSRIDVFLELLGAEPNAGATLSNLSEIRLSDGATQDLLNELNAACSKCRLLGSQETASLAYELQNAFAAGLSKLLIAARPIRDVNTDIDITDSLYKESFSDGQRILAQIKNENESGRPDPARFKALMSAFESTRSTYTAYSNERNEHWQRKISLQRPYYEAVKEVTDGLGRISLLLNRSMRDDLGLETNLELFQKRYEENRDKLFSQLDEVLSMSTRQETTVERFEPNTN